MYKSINMTWGSNSKFLLKESGGILLIIENAPCNSGVLINNGDIPLCSYFKYP